MAKDINELYDQLSADENFKLYKFSSPDEFRGYLENASPDTKEILYRGFVEDKGISQDEFDNLLVKKKDSGRTGILSSALGSIDLGFPSVSKTPTTTPVETPAAETPGVTPIAEPPVTAPEATAIEDVTAPLEPLGYGKSLGEGPGKPLIFPTVPKGRTFEVKPVDEQFAGQKKQIQQQTKPKEEVVEKIITTQEFKKGSFGVTGEGKAKTAEEASQDKLMKDVQMQNPFKNNEFIFEVPGAAEEMDASGNIVKKAIINTKIPTDAEIGEVLFNNTTIKLSNPVDIGRISGRGSDVFDKETFKTYLQRKGLTPRNAEVVINNYIDKYVNTMSAEDTDSKLSKAKGETVAEKISNIRNQEDEYGLDLLAKQYGINVAEKARELQTFMTNRKRPGEAGYEQWNNQLTTLQKEMSNLVGGGEKLYNPEDGKLYDRDSAPKRAMVYKAYLNDAVKIYKDTDIDKLKEIRSNLMDKVKFLEDQYDKTVGPEWRGKEFFKTFTSTMTEGQKEAMMRQFDMLDNYKAQLSAVNSRLLTNTDIEPVTTDRTGQFLKGLKKALPGGDYTSSYRTVKDDYSAYVDALEGEIQLKPEEIAKKELTLGEEAFKGIGYSLPIMAEIIATRNVAPSVEAIRASKYFRPITRGALKVTGSRAFANLFTDAAANAAHGYITYAPTSETGATGVGETLFSQTVWDKIGLEKITKGWAPLVRYLGKTAFGTVGETAEEFVGEYANALSETDFDWKKATDETFGKDISEFGKKLAVYAASSAIMSAGFNTPELFLKSTRFNDVKKLAEEKLQNPEISEAEKEVIQASIKMMDATEKTLKDKEEMEGPATTVAVEPGTEMETFEGVAPEAAAPVTPGEEGVGPIETPEAIGAQPNPQVTAEESAKKIEAIEVTPEERQAAVTTIDEQLTSVPKGLISEEQKQKIKDFAAKFKKPLLIFKGLDGKKDVNGNPISVHKIEGTTWGSKDFTDASTYAEYTGNMGVFVVEGASQEKVAAPEDMPITEGRQEESRLITESPADIVELDVTDGTTTNPHLIIKTPAKPIATFNKNTPESFKASEELGMPVAEVITPKAETAKEQEVKFAKARIDTNIEKSQPVRSEKSSGTTQVATTVGSYVKAANLLTGTKGDILDYGAGLGLGTDAMSGTLGRKVESYEPNPERWQGKEGVTFTTSNEINKKYDGVVSLNVLNVVPKDIRDAIVTDIFDKLNVGGKAVISTRKWSGDVNAAKNAVPGPEDKSLIISRRQDGKTVEVFQKGFDGNELVDYVKSLLGDSADVVKDTSFGANGVIITKKAAAAGPQIETKFAKKAGEKTDADIDKEIIEQMGKTALVNQGLDLDTPSTTKEIIDVADLNSRLDNPLDTIKWGDYEGIPFAFTISDQLRTGNAVNPITKETITDLKGGIGFNGTAGNENAAWANTTEEEANTIKEKALDIYNKNKDLFEKLWADGKLPNGHIPMAVVKMAESAILSNEAVFRVGIQNIKTLPISNRKKAVEALRTSLRTKIDKTKADIKRGYDIKSPDKPYTENTIGGKKKLLAQYENMLSIIEKSNYTDIVDVLEDNTKFSLPEKALISNEVFYGKPLTPGGKEIDINKSRPGTLVSKVLLGSNNPALINIEKITNLLTEPSMKNIPSHHIVSIVAVDVKNPEVVETNHPNYKYGVKGKSIGILKQPVHIKDAFGEAYGSALGIVLKNEAKNSSISLKSAISQGAPVQSGLTGRVFAGAVAKKQLDAIDKLAGFLRQAFPSTTFFTTQDAWDAAMENPSVKKKLKAGEVVYGFTTNGNVYLNPNLKNSKVLLHETGHVWMAFVKDNNPALFETGLKLTEGTKELELAKEQYGDTELAREEALMELMSTKGDTIVNAAQKKDFKNWLMTLWQYVRDTFRSFASMTPDQVQNLTLGEFIDGMLSDILSGRELTAADIKTTTKFSAVDTKIAIEQDYKNFKLNNPGATNMEVGDFLMNAQGYTYGQIERFIPELRDFNAESAKNGFVSDIENNRGKYTQRQKDIFDKMEALPTYSYDSYYEALKGEYGVSELYRAFYNDGATPAELDKIFGTEYRATIEKALKKGNYNEDFLRELDDDIRSRKMDSNFEQAGKVLSNLQDYASSEELVDHFRYMLGTSGIGTAVKTITDEMRLQNAKLDAVGDMLKGETIKATTLLNLSELFSLSSNLLRMARGLYNTKEGLETLLQRKIETLYITRQNGKFTEVIRSFKGFTLLPAQKQELSKRVETYLNAKKVFEQEYEKLRDSEDAWTDEQYDKFDAVENEMIQKNVELKEFVNRLMSSRKPVFADFFTQMTQLGLLSERVLTLGLYGNTEKQLSDMPKPGIWRLFNYNSIIADYALNKPIGVFGKKKFPKAFEVTQKGVGHTVSPTIYRNLAWRKAKQEMANTFVYNVSETSSDRAFTEGYVPIRIWTDFGNGAMMVKRMIENYLPNRKNFTNEELATAADKLILNLQQTNPDGTPKLALEHSKRYYATSGLLKGIFGAVPTVTSWAVTLSMDKYFAKLGELHYLTAYANANGITDPQELKRFIRLNSNTGTEISNAAKRAGTKRVFANDNKITRWAGKYDAIFNNWSQNAYARKIESFLNAKEGLLGRLERNRARGVYTTEMAGVFVGKALKVSIAAFIKIPSNVIATTIVKTMPKFTWIPAIANHMMFLRDAADYERKYGIDKEPVVTASGKKAQDEARAKLFERFKLANQYTVYLLQGIQIGMLYTLLLESGAVGAPYGDSDEEKKKARAAGIDQQRAGEINWSHFYDAVTQGFDKVKFRKRKNDDVSSSYMNYGIIGAGLAYRSALKTIMNVYANKKDETIGEDNDLRGVVTHTMITEALSSGLGGLGAIQNVTNFMSAAKKGTDSKEWENLGVNILKTGLTVPTMSYGLYGGLEKATGMTMDPLKYWNPEVEGDLDWKNRIGVRIWTSLTGKSPYTLFGLKGKDNEFYSPLASPYYQPQIGPFGEELYKKNTLFNTSTQDPENFINAFVQASYDPFGFNRYEEFGAEIQPYDAKKEYKAGELIIVGNEIWRANKNIKGKDPKTAIVNKLTDSAMDMSKDPDYIVIDKKTDYFDAKKFMDNKTGINHSHQFMELAKQYEEATGSTDFYDIFSSRYKPLVQITDDKGIMNVPISREYSRKLEIMRGIAAREAIDINQVQALTDKIEDWAASGKYTDPELSEKVKSAIDQQMLGENKLGGGWKDMIEKAIKAKEGDMFYKDVQKQAIQDAARRGIMTPEQYDRIRNSVYGEYISPFPRPK